MEMLLVWHWVAPPPNARSTQLRPMQSSLATCEKSMLPSAIDYQKQGGCMPSGALCSIKWNLSLMIAISDRAKEQRVSCATAGELVLSLHSDRLTAAMPSEEQQCCARWSPWTNKHITDVGWLITTRWQRLTKDVSLVTERALRSQKGKISSKAWHVISLKTKFWETHRVN